jgi:MFS family permease
MLVLAIVTSVMTGPGQTIGVSVFIDHLVAALDTSRSVVSTAYLIGTLTGAAALPFVGRFVDRRGVRTAQLLVGAAFAVALVFMAGVNGVLWLTVGFAGIRMFGQGSLSMISSVTVALWFERRRGLAMGILATAAGALMTMVPVVLNAVIEATSWRIAWLVAAGAVAATVLPIAHFGLVARPADVGQRPDGDRGDEPESDRSVGERHALASRVSARPLALALPGYTRAEATRTSQFWILALIGSVSGMLTTGLNFHQIDLLGDAGLSSGEAAAMFLPQILGSSSTALGIGYALDRIGTRFVPAISMAMLAVVHVLAANLDGGVMILVYAVALGAVGGMVRAALSTMIPGYFGTAHIGSIQGMLNVAMVGGSALGPVALAVAEAAFGGYRSANLWLMIIPIVTTLVALTNRPMRPRPVVESGTMEACVAT